MKKLTKILLVTVMILVTIAGVAIMRKYDSMLISDVEMFFYAEEIKFDNNYVKLDTYDTELDSKVDCYIPLTRLENEAKAIATMATLGIVFASCGINLFEKNE